MDGKIVPIGQRTASRPVVGGTVSVAIEAASMKDLLRLHERYFGRLDPKGRARMAHKTRAGTPDGRSYGMDGLAA